MCEGGKLLLEEVKTGLVVNRWQMHRAGILNFWYYENDEFQLEEGRLILRGANGSGKSVTMQSFLPLVLDGDKRPYRLDPFGSRDRRIEYYLLGDADSSHLERTGYLWIEFFHPQRKIYKTIGIGLQARKGAPQVGFWGFLIHDGRRINKDIWLYDHNLFLEQGHKKPLSRKILEGKIGAGGLVVQEQAAYRSMVNKELFGFNEQDSYLDLLQLLVQLRSPKLSKDFKPSTIYEILTQALPPLLEEELNPLSEVMEDMDQISDRLEELELHRQETEKIQKAYDKYNCYLLYQHSVEVVECHSKYNQFAQKVNEEEITRVTAESEYLVAEQAWQEKTNRLQEVDAKLEILNQSEAIEKQRELELNERQLSGIEEHIQTTNVHIDKNRDRVGELERDLQASNIRINTLVQEQNQTLEDLENIAREVEFQEHDVYHRNWVHGIPEDDRWRAAWRRDLNTHKQALEAALAVSQAEREARNIAYDVELQLGDIHKERHQIEKEHTEQEQAVELQKDNLRECLVQWQQELRYLPFNRENLQESLHTLSLIGIKERNYEVVRQPAISACEERRQYYVQKETELIQEEKRVQEDYARLHRDREEWLINREPEPMRSEARSRARTRRNFGLGAPFYTVCDFQSSLNDGDKAKIEETLERAGLLDAWIAPGGRMIIMEEGEEEVWIEPNPQMYASTLAEVLLPVPSLESGLSQEDINLVLHSFRWEENEEMFLGRKEKLTPWFYANGAFQLGPLIGKTTSKLRAELIGKETRRRTKELVIAQLDIAIDVCKDKIKQIDVTLENFSVEKTLLEKELQSFPTDVELQEAFNHLSQIKHKLKAILGQEEKLQERHKEKIAAWRKLQLALSELTANWSLLKKEKELIEAINLCIEYDHGISELYSSWGRYQDTSQQQIKMQVEKKEVSTLLEGDKNSKKELEDRQRILKAQVELLRQKIHEMGIDDLHLQISQLKSEKEFLNKEINKAQRAKEESSNRLSVLKDRIKNHQEELQQLKVKLNSALHGWQIEMKLVLVQDWKELFLSDMAETDIISLCKEISKEYSAQFTNRTKEGITSTLLEEFNAVRHSLSDYALESDVDERTGRITILSMRDRVNPQPPWKLLEEFVELENEQRNLLSQKDRELYEEIILRSVGKAIRQRIHRATDWVKQMNHLMEQRNTSSGLRLSLNWIPKARQTEQQLDTEKLVDLLLREADRLDDNEIEQIITHFRSGVAWAKQEAQQERESLRKYIYDLLDYRSWFRFELSYRKGAQTGYKELTDSRFNVLSGGEKAMAMYIPLFAATYSRYSDAHSDAPKIISLDEAFAGVDEENMRDMFQLLTDMRFDYIMTSQVLWGCYDTVPSLAIYELIRPKDADFITLLHYRWNGRRKELMDIQEEIEYVG